jgi:cell division septal protein FtsQ
MADQSRRHLGHDDGQVQDDADQIALVAEVGRPVVMVAMAMVVIMVFVMVFMSVVIMTGRSVSMIVVNGSHNRS